MNFTFLQGKQKEPANVVFVGSTGVGKSSFGNWIHDFGQGEPIFKIGNAADPCTQNVVNKVVRVCADRPLPHRDDPDPNVVELNLIDTPGLNEEDAHKDLLHMSDLLKVMHTLKKISCVVVCIEYGFRRDSQVVATLNYYKKLFQPVFAAGNVVIVLTKVDSNDYGILSSEEWHARMEVYRASISKIINYDITNVFALSSRFPDNKLAKVIDRTFPGALKFPPKTNLITQSLIARLQFITLVSQLSPISMEGHLFPLPPCIEVIRKSHLNIIKQKLNQIQVTLAVENEISAMFIKSELALHNEIDQLTLQIDANEKVQREKKQIQRTEAQIAYGNSIMFHGKVKSLHFNCPLDQFEVETQKYNCNYKKKKSTQPSSHIHTYKPVVDTFAFISTNLPDGSADVRWYLRMQLVYSGIEYYKQDLAELMMQKANLMLEKGKKEREKALEEAKHREKDVKIEGHQKQIEELEQQKEMFVHNLFELTHVPQLVELLMSGNK